MVDITFDMFFDRENVKRHVKDGTKSFLSKAGAFARRTMKGIIRAGKKPAKPGTPPKSHTGLFKEKIYFGFDESTQSVVVGPSFFKKQSPPVPQLLNEGGSVPGNGRTIYVDPGQGRDASGRFVSGKRAVRVTGNMQYRSFPYVAPTWDKVEPQFPKLFSNAIT